ncbi:MAG: hypothetical protein MMC33_006304 [Icmadophila ericetorum]|nr:hypothetical protein [Icmadophila ericetorum]
MAYLAPIHRPSSVRHALKLNFLSQAEECLVVAKANRLEFYAQTPSGLALRHTRSVYGKITMLEKFHPAGSVTDHLFVGTDRYIYFTVSWDSSSNQLRTEKSYVDQADKTGRDSQTLDRCLIDPTGRFMTLELFEGQVTVIPIIQKSRKRGDPEIGSLDDPVPVRISELFVRSSAYLYPRSPNPEKEKPRMAILFEDSHQKIRLKVRTVEYSAGGSGEPGMGEMVEVDIDNNELDAGASHIIPVPAPAYGLLILSETSISYLDEDKHNKQIKPLKEATVFATWEKIDGQRWLLADEYGRLYLLMLLIGNDGNVYDWQLDLLGTIPTATILVYLDGGYVFAGSHQGDSQVIRILDGSIEVIQIFPNIAPILDFTIMDMGSRVGEGQTSEFSSGQARIVTGSGAFQDGSLRSVRSGVGLEELGSLGEMDHITNLFALRSDSDLKTADVLAVSFIDETRVFRFENDGEVEEMNDFKGFNLSRGSLLACNISNGMLLQVTSTFVQVNDSEGGVLHASWSPPKKQVITACSSNGRYLALSIGGVEVAILDTILDLHVVSKKTFGIEKQIACIHLPEIVPDVCIIGFWQGADISIFKITNFEMMQHTTISENTLTVPRSVLLTQILQDQPPTLFVAMADGNVVTFSFDTSNFSLSSKSSIVLGTEQANFKALPRGDGLYNVFATCEHPSLIYGSEGRIIYSSVTAEKATCVCSFDSEAYPDAIAIASSKDLKIALVDTERTTHVQTLPIGETVRRVAYSTNLKVFGLGTIKRTLKAGVEVVQSHFKLADEVVFEELDTYELNEDELVESVIRADLKEGSQKSIERFVVGTAYLDDGHESVRGRILVFEVTQNRTLRVVTEVAVKGACRALAIVDGNIAAALIKTVVIYAFEYGSLRKVTSYRTSTAPIDIAVIKNMIVIADLMKSVSIVEYHKGINGEPDTLTEVARHFQIAWGTAVAPIDKDTILESDAEGNLMVLHRNVHGVTADDRRRLEITSEILLGEMVNRIRPINVPNSSNAIVIPKAFMGTVDGSIYLFALIQQDKQDLLMRLQTNISKCIQSPGNIPFNKFRAFKNQVREAEEPYRFVDGELIEKFLGCPSSLQEEIVQDLGVTVEHATDMVEALRRLH